MTGRPTKFSQATADFIVTMIESGVPRDHAARAAGIHKSTLYAWLAQGRAETWIEPDDHTKKELLRIARDRDVDIPKSATKPEIADAINTARSPLSEFSDRVYAADSRFLAAAIGKMREVGGDDWRMWREQILMRYPELNPNRAGDDTLTTELPDHLEAGTDADAERRLERAEAIRVKMLGTGTDG
jgi:hypothetical protein